ncbi:hypothetical protein [Cyanobium gracile]|uniref:Uncharacterized protein n=1 Tax=Cyanobium gracile (strain ATCC 27147 / PCC 6307) TaxID=292564 RepID=K9P937_CYAGP|nr:hypothetical protein [Cyanobium gracile]AFY29468.1 hypothetical protein Cyagr_2361 [Cyanobium gracile PCC 6307]
MPTASLWKRWTGRWIIACVVTQLFELWGDGLAGWIFSAMGVSPGPGALLPLVVMAVIRLFSGALGGLAQGRVLKSRFPFTISWVVATSLGSAIALVLVFGWHAAAVLPSVGPMILDALQPPRSVLPPFIFASLTGLVLGVAQWLALRGHVEQAGRWVLFSVLGLTAADLLTGVLQRSLGAVGLDVSTGAWNPVFWVISAVGIALYGLLTSRFWVARFGR